jgi:hypothetical protein
VAQYFDHREQQWKSVPDCGAHQLRWNAQTQRCEQCALCGLGGIALLGFLIWLIYAGKL